MLSIQELHAIADIVKQSVFLDIDVITRQVAEKLRNHDKAFLSQRAAYKQYGQSKVMRWVENGQLKRFIKMNGKVNGFEYKIRDLDKLSDKQQLLKLK